MSVLITGRFNILHPGHIRLFKFARDLDPDLIVAIESDRLAGHTAHISEKLRLESVQSCALVRSSFIFDEPITSLIERLKPSIVVKGREHESSFNPEARVISSYGGRLLFSSGEMQFSSTDLIRKEVAVQSGAAIKLPFNYMKRHGITIERLALLVDSFSKLKVLTVGDLIVDDYITCEPLGMSQEDPTLVVTPVDKQRFIGGAGIVASHARGLGAKSTLVSVIGKDQAGEFIKGELTRSNIQSYLIEDLDRSTTLKERYRSYGKTMLRVSYLQQVAISIALQQRLIEKAAAAVIQNDLLIFSDFNYGALPQKVVDELIAVAKRNHVITVADSQSSSQIGDVGRFKGIHLLLPTEREARVSTQNREAGLVVLADQLRKKSKAKHILLKLGSDGVLVHSPSVSTSACLTDQVEALNMSPKDVAGAGDAMLVAGSLALAAGATIWEAACLGSIASAIQVGQLGNCCLSRDQIRNVLNGH